MRHVFACLVFVSSVGASASAQPLICQDTVVGEVPQLADVQARFDAATAAEVDQFDGMLVCHARVRDPAADGRSRHGPVRHAFGSVDLGVHIAFPARTDLFRFRGPEDTGEVTFSVPAVRLARGQILRAVLRDRDVITDDVIARFDLAFVGSTRLEGATDHASLVCLGIPATALRAEIDQRIADVERTLDAIDAAHPDYVGDAAAEPGAIENRAIAAVCSLASLIGMNDPAVVRFRDDLRRRANAMDARVAHQLAIATEASTRFGVEDLVAPTDLRLEVESYECGTTELVRFARRDVAGPVCFIRFRTRRGAPGDETFVFDAITAEGDVAPAESLLAFAGRRARVAREAAFGVAESSSAVLVRARDARLLRVRVGGRTRFLALPEATVASSVDVRGR